MLKKGLVQIYTGDGKGKTTAALGLAMRAAGAGNKVLIYQFLKPPALDTSERNILAEMDSTGPPQVAGITVESLDIQWDMAQSPEDEKMVADTKAAIRKALERISRSAGKKVYDVVILDEIVFCLWKGLAQLEDVRNIIDKRDRRVEIVLTGRGATKELIEMADLVTEMKNIKHPFDKGLFARRGIEF